MNSNFFIALIILGCFLLSDAAEDATTGQQTRETAATPATAKQKQEEIKIIRGRVTFIYDGDTIRVRDAQGEFHVVRLQGIDAPEDRQNYSKQSRKSLSSIIISKWVRVAYSKKDADGRLVGVVYLGKADVNLKQIEAGAAWHYKRFAGEQTAQERERYAQAELTARAERKGLWRAPDPTPPWEYGRSQSKAIERATQPEQTIKTPTSETRQPEKQKAAEPDESNAPAAIDESGRKYFRGKRGGCYYTSASGRRVYVERSRCDQKPQ
jgi:endonuclease YncB( thermonuclease family)